MPKMKHQVQRLCAIYSIIRNVRYPSKDNIIDRIYYKTGSQLCASSIEKDFYALKNEFNVTIRYNRLYQGYYIPFADESTDIKFVTNLFIQLGLDEINLVRNIIDSYSNDVNDCYY